MFGKDGPRVRGEFALSQSYLYKTGPFRKRRQHRRWFHGALEGRIEQDATRQKTRVYRSPSGLEARLHPWPGSTGGRGLNRGFRSFFFSFHRDLLGKSA
jgi:hypothetical protein